MNFGPNERDPAGFESLPTRNSPDHLHAAAVPLSGLSAWQAPFDMHPKHIFETLRSVFPSFLYSILRPSSVRLMSGHAYDHERDAQDWNPVRYENRRPQIIILTHAALTTVCGFQSPASALRVALEAVSLG